MPVTTYATATQASMIHSRFTRDSHESETLQDDFHDTFNESYMMHGSTSPQYAMEEAIEPDADGKRYYEMMLVKK